LKSYTLTLISMMLITRIGSIKVIIMLTVKESIHRNYGSTRSRRKSRHINRHRSRIRRSILTRLRISYRGTSIRGLITDSLTSISRLITDRRASICGLITDRCHNGGHDRLDDSLRHIHFYLIVVVTVVVVLFVVMVSMVVLFVVVVSMVVVIVVFAYFDVNMTTAKAKADRLLSMVSMVSMMSVVMVV